ncbi:MAG: malto-oligosyltrehalose synthase, partial [Acidobacteria bacterium]|nr:malto-oligosyltrehalose synthase [Acidobacteriota bacterium]
HHDGSFFVHYYETRLLIAPRSASAILKALLESLPLKTETAQTQRAELESILIALEHLPPRHELDPEQVKQRRREKEIIKRRLAALVGTHHEVKLALEQVVHEFNGVKGEPRSFDRLEELLADQAYRLSFWRVAADEINYRRFFDVNELAAIRVEEAKVFTAVHRLVFDLLRAGIVTGLRIDHIDGLLDPARYLEHLCRVCQRAQKGAAQPQPLQCYVVVEKILSRDERLRPDWAAQGTTGYEFLNLLNGLLVESQSQTAFRQIWRRLAGVNTDFEDVAYEGKKLILHAAMSGELHVLARKLERLAEQHRYSRDFTLNSLQEALGEVIACFPVYRSYMRFGKNEAQPDINAEDRRSIQLAVRRAQLRNPSLSQTIFAFIRSLLLFEEPDGLAAEQQKERRKFVLRFQQLTGPVTAKGVEDTAFYRYYPLASLCEVGGHPARFGTSIAAFHEANQQRLKNWPHTLLATSTHDTKRGEDVRARLNVLSEIPARWSKAVQQWQRLNRKLKPVVDDAPVPDAREEYLLYQTLIGSLPFHLEDETALQAYVQRMQDYLVKALREAKLHSSWLNPNEEYEQAVRDFIARILSANTPFLAALREFHPLIARAGAFNSLAQTLLKITVPGVPDFYQGTELWDLSLVDPDNRQPVDYATRQRLFAEVGEFTEEWLRHPADGKIKLFTTSRALAFRRDHGVLFERGEYLPLPSTGARAHHVVSFARRYAGQTVIVVAARFFAALLAESDLPIGAPVWGDTRVQTPADLSGCYRDAFTGTQVCINNSTEGLPLAAVGERLPLALLERV